MSEETLETTTPAIENTETVTTPETPATEPTTDTAPLAAEGAVATPEYQPELKFRYKGEEREIDEFWRPLIKDKVAEDKVRDFMQRAVAMDDYKAKVQELSGWQEEHQPVVDQVLEVAKLFNTTETGPARIMAHERALEMLGFSSEDIKNVALAQYERSKLPPEHRELFDSNKSRAIENEQLRRQNEVFQQRAYQEMVSATGYQLDQALEKQEVKQVAEMYDRAHGTGSFKAMVVDRGSYLVDRKGQHVPPSEVVSSVMRDIQPFISGNQTPGMGLVQEQKKPKVIPNVGGGNSAPATRSVKSLDDIRAIHKQMTGQE